MQTLNYVVVDAGTLVASGAGGVTVTATDNDVLWLIGTSDTVAPNKLEKHRLTGLKDRSMELEAGEHLWLFGDARVAVTAAVPAAGDV